MGYRTISRDKLVAAYQQRLRPDQALLVVTGANDFFRGEAVQTANWPHREVKFKDRRIGIIGTDGPAGTSPYTSAQVDNRPPTADIVRTSTIETACSWCRLRQSVAMNSPKLAHAPDVTSVITAKPGKWPTRSTRKTVHWRRIPPFRNRPICWPCNKKKPIV